MSDITENFYKGSQGSAVNQATADADSFSKRQPAKGMLLVKIYTPFHTYFEGDAKSLTAINESGTFDILPGHHNFITMLLPCDVTLDTPSGQQVIPILRGLLHVRGDKLIIFLDV
jgi:F0F1-type ATP synthase epsilon subunit